MRNETDRKRFMFKAWSLLMALALAFCCCTLDTSGTRPECSDLPSVSDHFYTTDLTERNSAMAGCYIDDGVPIACYIFKEKGIFSPSADAVPFFRLFNQGVWDHFYTTDAAERDKAIKELGYTDEGIAGYVYQNPKDGTVPLFHLFRP